MHTTAVARLLYLIHKLKKAEFFFKIIFLHSAVGQRASSKSKKVLYCKPLKGKNYTSFTGFFSTVQKVDPMSFAVHLVFRENCQKMRLRVNWLGTKQSLASKTLPKVVTHPLKRVFTTRKPIFRSPKKFLKYCALKFEKIWFIFAMFFLYHYFFIFCNFLVQVR